MTSQKHIAFGRFSVYMTCAGHNKDNHNWLSYGVIPHNMSAVR